MEPQGREQHGRVTRLGELPGESESIEVRVLYIPHRVSYALITRSCVPGGNRTHI